MAMTTGGGRRILLSAYACEPGKGSEPEVGWQWAVGLARRGHEVWVLTRANNRSSIEPALSELNLRNLHFVYFDLPAWVLRLKRWMGVNIYYRLWQHAALATVRTLHKRVQFQYCQHATFVTIRHPSLLRHLDVPYTLGPVSGGECAPPALLKGLPMTFRAAEAVRRWSTLLLMRTPSVRDTLSRAKQVVVTSTESEALVSTDWRHKVVQHLAIATVTPPTLSPDTRRAHKPLRALYVGRLLHWKGLHLGIAAIGTARRAGCKVRLTIVGQGPAEGWLRALAQRERVAEDVVFEPWRERGELCALYAEHDVLLFPSLRDSGGMVVLEAMQHGLPTICLSLGGPGQIVDDRSGIVVRGSVPAQVIEDIAHALGQLAASQSMYTRLASGAVARAAELSSDSLLTSLGY